MKRTLVGAVAIFVVFCLFSTCLAAGKLSVTQEDFHVIDIYSLYGYCYARVENVGDKPIKVQAGILEIFDQEGETITSTDYLASYAEYLQPDEYTYVYLNAKIDDVETASDVDDYMLTITGKSDTDKTSMRLPCESDYQENVTSGYWTYNYMYGTVTNNTDETIYDITIVLALLDEEDRILYIDTDTLYNEGLTPGSSLTYRADISSSFMEHFEAAGLKPTRVDAIAYVNVEN